jgi:hypothetical protein
MALLPKVKLKTVVNFPSNVSGRVGIDVEREGGVFYLDLDYEQFAPPVAILPPQDVPNLNTLLWDQVRDSYVLTPISLLTGGGGGGGPVLTPAYTFRGNPTAGAASSSDVSITALTNKPVPADADSIMIADSAAAGAWKQISVASVRNPGSTTVTSIGGASGNIAVFNGIKVAANALGNDWVTIIDTLDNTGATDVGAALNAAIQAAPQFSILILPFGIYQTSVTILLNGGRTLQGMSGGINNALPTAGTCIRGALGLATVVRMDGEGGSSSCTLRGVQITREAGAIPAVCYGLQLYHLNNSLIEDVYISRCAVGIYFVDLNVTVRLNRVTTFGIVQFHWYLQAQAIEIYFDNCRCGINGSADFNGVDAYMVLDGGAWDTIRVYNSQWNQGVPGGLGVKFGIQFMNFNGANPNGILMLNNMHIEGINTFFVVGANNTAPINRFGIVGCQINLACEIFGSPAMFTEVTFTGARIMTPIFTVDRQNNMVISGCIFSASPVIVNAVTGFVCTGNLFYGSVTLEGACSKSIFTGNAVGGTLNNAASGMVVTNNA